jgi:hypothetical protein
MGCCEKIIAASGKTTSCECSGPGFCQRHQCNKPAHFYNLCKNRVEYFEKWEQGKGPGQVKLPTAQNPIPLGDWLASTIKLVTLGKIAPCTGCQSRAAKLNQLGAKIAGLFNARK